MDRQELVENITIKVINQKFGTRFPDMETLCKFCGERFGNHYGTECPSQDREGEQ